MEPHSTILVTGAGGMLGRALVTCLERLERRCIAATRGTLDLRSRDLASRVEALRPSAVINAAAYSDVGAAERPEHRAEAFGVNRDGAGGLARACASAGLPLVHVSTDYVFDGRKTEPYVEDDPVGPLQIYGQSKLEGELAVARELPSSVIVRTSTLFGPGRRPRPHYVDAIRAQTADRDRIEVVRLPVSSPTYAPDLAEALIALLDAGASGIVHFANAGACSRLELALETVRRVAPDGRIEVVERPAPTGGLARPEYSVLATGRYTRLTGRTVRPWQAALAAYVELG